MLFAVGGVKAAHPDPVFCTTAPGAPTAIAFVDPVPQIETILLVVLLV